ncbi:MAG: hypothetical protein ABEJ25_04385 [Candidatus Bipolaricaulia bacterium]
MLWFVIGMAVGLLGATVRGLDKRRNLTRNQENGLERFIASKENSKAPFISEKERELY